MCGNNELRGLNPVGAAVARTHLKAFLVANLDLNDQAHGLREQLGASVLQATP